MAAVINSSSVLPILEDGFFEYKDGTLKITVTDLETVISTKITLTSPSIPKAPFCFCVPFKLFKDAIDNCETDTIELTHEDRSGIRVSLSNEDFMVKLPVEDYNNFPKQPETIMAPDFNISIAATDILPQLFTAIQFASNDDLRPGLTGVCLCNAGGKMTLVATDAHRLYKKSLLDKPSPILALEGKNWILPKKSARILCSLFKKAFTIKANDDFMECFNNEYYIIFRLIDARFPDWKVVWPNNNPHSFIAKRKKFKAMLTMALPFTNRSTYQVAFKIQPLAIEAKAEDVDFSIEFYYKMAIFENTNAENTEIAFNSRFFYQALTVNKDENVKVSYATATKAIVIDDELLIMPLMLNN